MAALMAAGCGSSDGPNGPPPLRNKIVFVSDRTGEQQIFVMNPDGSGQLQLTTIDGIKAWPAISPNGRKIAFSTGDIEDGGASTLHVMNSDGSDLKALTSAPGVNYKPSWSPNGERIAFGSTRDGNQEVYTMNADGSAQVNRTNADTYDFDAAWRPVGSSILIASNRFNPPSSAYIIFSMTPSGDSLTPLVNGLQPEWAPSGTKFLYKTTYATWIALTPDASSTAFLFSDAEQRHYTPTWSPDESRLAYSLRADSHEEIWTMSATDGGDARQLTTVDQGNNSYPTWSRH
jgi:Tol biopolymer transport system component